MSRQNGTISRTWRCRCGWRSPAWLEHRLELAGRTADDLQHLRRRGLLLQRFGEIVGTLAQFLEQPRVLDRDDGLGGEVLHQLDLLFGERTNLGPIDADGADRLVVLEHGDIQQRAHAREVGAGHHDRFALEVAFFRPHIVDVYGAPGSGRPDKGGVRPWTMPALQELDESRRRAQHGDRTGDAVFEPEHEPELGLADARRVLQHGLEHRIQIARRAGDDLQYLRCGSLLLERLGQVVGALAQLAEQARVLDGDDGLRGKILDQFDLFLAEGPHLLAVHRNGADELAFPQHRHRQERAGARDFDQRDDPLVSGEIRGVLCHIEDVQDLFALPDAIERNSGRIRSLDHWVAPVVLGVTLLAVYGDTAEIVCFAQKQVAERGLADTGRVGQHGFENGLELARRFRNDLKHLTCRGLLLQRFAQIAGALAQFVEQPRVIDGDDRLRGECFQKRNLLFRKRPHLAAPDHDGAERDLALHEWHRKRRADFVALDRRAAIRKSAVGDCKGIADVDDLVGDDRASAQRAAGDRSGFTDLERRDADAVGREAKALPVDLVERGIGGFAQPHGALYDRIRTPAGGRSGSCL